MTVDNIVLTTGEAVEKAVKDGDFSTATGDDSMVVDQAVVMDVINCQHGQVLNAQQTRCGG